MTGSIVLHPGFPKCATSTLQRLFVVQDHALARELGVVVLGKEFKPMNGYPPVTELMYSPIDCMQMLRNQDYPPGRYFLSSEALASRLDFIAEFARIFTLSRMVVTVRFPAIQALSQYRYSGWLKQNLRDLLTDLDTSPLHAHHRHRSKMVHLSSLAETLACPIEGAGLAERFCLASFAQTPAQGGDAPIATPHQTNESIGLGFATALREALVEQNLVVKGADRSRLVKLAQRWRLPTDVTNLMPVELVQADLDPVLDTLEEYKKMLLDYGVSKADTRVAIATAEENIRHFTTQPRATQSQMNILKINANSVVQAFVSNN